MLRFFFISINFIHSHFVRYWLMVNFEGYENIWLLNSIGCTTFYGDIDIPLKISYIYVGKNIIEHFIFNVRPFTTDYQYLLFLSSSIGNEMKLVYLEAKINILSCLFIHSSTFMICLPCLPLSLSIHDVIEEKHDSNHALGLSEFNEKLYT